MSVWTPKEGIVTLGKDVASTRHLDDQQAGSALQQLWCNNSKKDFGATGAGDTGTRMAL
jgi:hypothetical protein